MAAKILTSNVGKMRIFVLGLVFMFCSGVATTNSNYGDGSKNSELLRVKRQFLYFPNQPSLDSSPDVKVSPAEDAGSPDCSSDLRCLAPHSPHDETCLNAGQVCDGNIDCKDATDELDCSCRERISAKFVCDGSEDCPDGQDEEGCGPCEAGERACFPSDPSAPTLCLKSHQICDGFRHCQDGSDEFCYRLVDDPALTQGPRGWFSQGFLQRKEDEEWRAVCAASLSDEDLESVAKNLCNDVVEERIGSDTIERVLHQSGGLRSCPSDLLVRVSCSPPACHSSIDIGRTAGRSSSDHSPSLIQQQVRIIGGENATEGSWPSIVSLRKDGAHDCGGTILNDSYVMVAAHCMRRAKGHTFEVRAGLYRRSSYAPTVQLRVVQEAYIHSNFSGNSLVNDIALLQLSTPLQLNKWVRPVCLPDGDKIWMPNHECAIAGWGFMKPRNQTVMQLQHTLLPLTSLAQCQHVYSTKRIPDPQQVLCAGLQQGGKDACSGDSGGPMMCRVCTTVGSIVDCNNNEWTQDGIVSFGKGCAEPGIPGVYTRVQHYLPWIRAILDSTGHGEGVRKVRLRTRSQRYCQQPWNAVLASDKFCDGQVDCLNAEDEINYPECEKKSTVPEAPVNHTYHPISPVTDAPFLNQSCPTGYQRCLVDKDAECVKKCDGVSDCRDGRDEQGCSCSLRLFATQKRLLCDGVPDCPDSGDEFCPLCPEGSHECIESKQCVEEDNVCNQLFDCNFGEDEIGCISLASNDSDVLLDSDGSPTRRSHGFLVVGDGLTNVFKPVCTPTVVKQKVDSICNFLGYENTTSTESVDTPADAMYFGRFKSQSMSSLPDATDSEMLLDMTEQELEVQDLVKSASNTSELLLRSTNSSDIESMLEVNITEVNEPSNRQASSEISCSQVYVRCGPLKCGVVPRVLRNKSNYTGVSSQPWAVGIYTRGQYICGGTLIDTQWVLSSAACFRANRYGKSDALVVVGGSHRGPISGMRIKGPYEREQAVQHVLHVSSSLVLLKLEDDLLETSRIVPLCLPIRTADWPGNWQQCAVVGYDGELLTRHLPLSPASPCPKGKVCFRPYDLPDHICTNKWSGLIACLNSTERAAQWVGVGVWQHTSEGCSQPTQHTLLSKDILLAVRLGMVLPSTSTRTPCLGHQCPFDKCITYDRVCDGVPDCADFSDEPSSCPPSALRCQHRSDIVNCECPEQERTCWDGTCLPQSKFCDGIRDCAQGEDELGCSCANLQTDRPDAVCDGRIDCIDEEDERNCSCPLSHGFRCFTSGNSRRCIALDLVCDKKPDCPNEEDELFCSTFLPLPSDLPSDRPVDTSLLTVDQDVLGRPRSHSSGLMLVRYNGLWLTIPASQWQHDFSVRLCSRLGYSQVETSSRTLLPHFARDSEISHRSVYGVSRSSQSPEVDLNVVHVECL